MQDKIVLVEQGAYRAELKLFNVPYEEMFGMLSIADPEREIFIKLEADDIINLKLSIQEYCEDKEL
jgi:hypothetical protein